MNIKITRVKLWSGETEENLFTLEIRSLKTSWEFLTEKNEKKITKSNFKEKADNFSHQTCAHIRSENKTKSSSRKKRKKKKSKSAGFFFIPFFCVFNSQNYFINEIIRVFGQGWICVDVDVSGAIATQVTDSEQFNDKEWAAKTLLKIKYIRKFHSSCWAN